MQRDRLYASENAFDPTLVSWSAGEGFSIPDPDHGTQVAPPPLVYQKMPKVFDRLVQAQLIPSDLPMSETPPGRLQGGVTMRYEALRIAANRFDFWQLPLKSYPDGRSWPRRAYLEPGAAGPEAGRVHIDTRQTALPSMNVKVFYGRDG